MNSVDRHLQREWHGRGGAPVKEGGTVGARGELDLAPETQKQQNPNFWGAFQGQSFQAEKVQCQLGKSNPPLLGDVRGGNS